MGGTSARSLVRALAVLLALSGGGQSSLAAPPPGPNAAGEPPVAETIVDKVVDKIVVAIDENIGENLGEKIGEQVDEGVNKVLEGTIGEQNIERIDESHDDQVRLIGEFFEKVDRLFGEQYVEDRERAIRIRAGLETTFNADGVSTDTKVKIALRVPLPALKRRFNGFIDIGGDVNELGAVSNPSFSESTNDFSLAAGLLRRFRDNLEAGIKLKLFSSGEVVTIQPFLRFDQQYGPMRYFFEQKVIWQSDDTWSTQSDFDVDRRFRSRLFLRLRNRVDYSFEQPGASIAHGLIMRRAVYESNGLSLELWLEYRTTSDEPETIADDTIAYAQLRLRGRVWRNWLEYELRPIYTIPIDTDRDPFFGFYVSLTLAWDSFLGGGTGGPDAAVRLPGPDVPRK